MSRTRSVRGLACTALATASLASCGDDTNQLAPVDASGTYTLAMTNRDNRCEFDNWEVGAQTSGVNLIITQENAEITGEVQSLAGLFLLAATGSTTFRGKANSSGVRMDIEGNVKHTPMDDPDCEFWVDAELIAELNNDALDGTIVYIRRVAPGFTCPADSGCRSTQEFAGVRAPK